MADDTGEEDSVDNTGGGRPSPVSRQDRHTQQHE
jgi:hypothetical protein